MQAILVGEPVALDLVNTRANGPDGEIDLLGDAEALHRWLAAMDGRLPKAEQPFSDADAALIRALREQIEIAVNHARNGERPPEAAVRAITGAQRSAPAYQELAWDGDALTVSRRRIGGQAAVLAAELAEAATGLLTDPSVQKVRQCAGPGCRLLFLPAHPRRQWCSPALCGNRVRVARYYQRHKS